MAKNALVQIPAQIVDFRPRADRSYKISFESRQLTGEEVSILADNYQGEGWLVFKPNGDVSTDEIPAVPAEAGVKSPSQRLRDVMYLVWKSNGSHGSFNNYYDTQYQRLTEFFKEKITEG